jgi:hypothetical protein
MNYHFSLFDLWPYFVAFLFLVYAGYQPERKSSKYLFIFLFIFSALRYNVGWDYDIYADGIKDAYSYGWNGIDGRYEYFSKIVFFIGAYFKFYPLVFIIYSFLTLFLVYRSVQLYSFNKYVSWLAYISMPLFYFASLSTIRQGIATSIILYSYNYLRSKRYIRFFMGIFIASLFHQSSIAGILLFPISLIKISKKVNFYILLISFFMVPLVQNFTFSILTSSDVNERLLTYINSENNKPRFIQYLYYAIGLFNIFNYKKLVSANYYNSVYIQIYNIGILVYNVLIFEPTSAMRISAFYLISIIYLMPHYVEIFKNKIISEYGLKIFLLLTVCVYFYINISAFTDGINQKIGFVPYDMWILHFDEL